MQIKPPQLVGQHLPMSEHCASEKQDWLQIRTGKGGGQEPGFSKSYLKTLLFQFYEEDSQTCVFIEKQKGCFKLTISQISYVLSDIIILVNLLQMHRNQR